MTQRRHRVRARPRRRRDRRDHVVHQHVQPVGDDRGRACWPRRPSSGPEAQAVGQDDAGAGLQGRHGLLRPLRPDALPREARLQPRRLRLHDLHRQLRAAIPRGEPGGQRRTTSPWRRCSRATATSRAGSTPTCKMNYLASPPLVVAYALAGSMDVDMHTEPLGQDSSGNDVYLRDIWPSAEEVEEIVANSITARDVHRRLRRRLRRRRALEGPADARRRHLRVGRRLDVRAQAAVLRRHAGRADAGGGHPRRAGAGQARRLGHHRPHLSPAGAIKTDSAGRRVPAEHGVEPRTSTPTARGAATTR